MTSIATSIGQSVGTRIGALLNQIQTDFSNLGMSSAEVDALLEDYATNHLAELLALDTPELDLRGNDQRTVDTYFDILVAAGVQILTDAVEEETLYQVGYTDVVGVALGVTQARTQQITMPEAGQIKSIAIYLGAGTTNFKLGVYSDDSDSPDALLAETAETASLNIEGWQTVELTSPLNVTSGTKYWLAWQLQSSSVKFWYQNGEGLYTYLVRTYDGTLPNPMVESGGGAVRHSIYANYTK